MGRNDKQFIHIRNRRVAGRNFALQSDRGGANWKHAELDGGERRATRRRPLVGDTPGPASLQEKTGDCHSWLLRPKAEVLVVLITTTARDLRLVPPQPLRWTFTTGLHCALLIHVPCQTEQDRALLRCRGP